MIAWILERCSDGRRQLVLYPIVLYAVGCSAALIVVTLSTGARADDANTLETGINSYEGGRYQECVDRFRGMLTLNSPMLLQDAALRKRARIYFAACLIAVKQDDDANEQMKKLILDDPRFVPDRAAFPGKVIDHFTMIRGLLKEEINRREKQLLEAEDAEKHHLEEERMRNAKRQDELRRLAQQVWYVKQNSRWIALVPFGVGQFQNHQTALGWSLFGTELAFAGASAVTYFIKQSIESQVQEGNRQRNVAQTDWDLAVRFNHLSFGAFAAVSAFGIVHAQLTFVPQTREERRRPLPPELSWMPSFGVNRQGAMVCFRGGF